MSAEQSGGRLDPSQGALALRFQLHYDDVAAFVRSYAVNVSPGGMFIATREPPAVGTVVRFEVLLADERPVLRGEGQVVWTARADEVRAGAPANPADLASSADSAASLSGLGVRFGRLDAPSHAVLTQVLAHKAAHPEQFFTQVPDPYASPIARPDYRRATEAVASAVAAPARPHASLPAASAASAPPPLPSAASAPPPSVSSAPAPRPSAASAPRPLPSAASEPLPLPSAASAPPPSVSSALAPRPSAASAPRPLPSAASEPLPLPSAASAPLPPLALTGDPLPPLFGLPPTSQWTPTATGHAAPYNEADEDAALQSLLAPVDTMALPTATDAARLLDELLDRKLG